jgi:hypothetical protein
VAGVVRAQQPAMPVIGLINARRFSLLTICHSILQAAQLDVPRSKQGIGSRAAIGRR